MRAGVSALLLSTLLCASCALFQKNESVVFRYFSPERRSTSTAMAADKPGAKVLQLKLGRVTSASHLRDKIAFRTSEFEIGFYEHLRWTERPESYLRRAMSRALFEEQHIQQVVGGGALTLEIDLNAFEELRVPRHTARVEVAWLLRNDRVVVAQRTLVVEHDITAAVSETEAGAIATAMADALGESIHKMVTEVVTELSREEPAK